MLNYFEPTTTHWFMDLELYINCFIYVWLLEHPVTLVTSVTPREPKAQTVSVNISHIGEWNYNTGRFSFTRNLVMRQSSEDLRLNTLVIRSLWDQKIARKSCVYSSPPPPTPNPNLLVFVKCGMINIFTGSTHFAKTVGQAIQSTFFPENFGGFHHLKMFPSCHWGKNNHS